MTTVHYAILAAATWRVVRWKVSPRRPAVRRGADRRPWLVALVNDAVIFGGLAYREHRRKAKAGQATAVRDRRRSSWIVSTPGPNQASRLRKVKPTDDDIPF